MINLIIKDLRLQKKSLLFAWVYFFFITIFAVRQSGNAALILTTTCLSYIFVMTPCAYEDKTQSHIMLNSLPISRNSIVLAKYLSIFVYLLIGFVCYFLVTAIVGVSGLPVKASPVTPTGIAAAIFLSGVMSSLQLPILFKVGYIKARMINMVMFFLIFFGAGTLLGKDKEWIKKLLLSLNKLSEVQVALLLITVTLVIMLISFALSLKFYKNREF